ncbi:hypothetical protein AAFF_G00174490 [Aldrovandia affinis]|uniref:Uncharacterized protein n=1 Tax=Aldrovandia affinis TaxID=143900 RepID=A0AAD7W778_9TELE|nr:hypothetical protein AAFF_G00174490 [Aldrovandia affinis]
MGDLCFCREVEVVGLRRGGQEGGNGTRDLSKQKPRIFSILVEAGAGEGDELEDYPIQVLPPSGSAGRSAPYGGFLVE